MITREVLGYLPDGHMIEAAKIILDDGAYVMLSSFGGAICRIVVPDKDGILGDVTLGYDTAKGLQNADGFMGFLIGRCGNRIGDSVFELNGKTYPLFANDGKNHLHGGKLGFDKRLWDMAVRDNAVVFSYVSLDGEEGYPGEMRVQVTYTFNEEHELGLHYEAASSADTVCNLTNHVYFNLSGPAADSITDHTVCIDADAITAVGDAGCIPTGELRKVEGTAFDLRNGKKIADGLEEGKDDAQMRFGNGYDHNFCLNGEGFRKVAWVYDEKSGRKLTVSTDQKGVQFYIGNSIGSAPEGKCGVPYHFRQGLCLETQTYPDAIHHPEFPTAILRAGEKYDTRTVYAFSAE